MSPTNSNTSASTATRKPILISGAGLASLLLARSLLRSGLPFRVFERDNSISFRAQGYRLRLSNEGLDAIEAVLGRDDGFPKFWDRCGKTAGAKGFAFLDAITGNEMPRPGATNQESKNTGQKDDGNTSKEQRNEKEHNDLRLRLFSRDGKTIGISRGDMRSLFLEGCEEYIQWGKHVVGYEHTADGVRAVFQDGSKSEEGDMLVGGEGIYSKVAKQVSNGLLKTYDTGARGIHGQAPTTAFKGLGEGVWMIRDSTNPRGLVSTITNVRPGDMDDPNIEFGFTMAGPSAVITPPNDDFAIIGKPAADLARQLTQNWHPIVKPLFDNINEAQAAFWKITCSTPSGVPEWPNDSRVTVIGDAAHSMTPAGGLGANTALRDSELLGRLLRESGGWADGITSIYEKEMRVYGSEAVQSSYGQARDQFNVNITEASPVVG